MGNFADWLVSGVKSFGSGFADFAKGLTGGGATSAVQGATDVVKNETSLWQQFGSKVSDNIGDIGKLYGAYNQQQMAKKNFNLQQDAYNYNKMLSDMELKRRKDADNSLNTAYSQSSYGGA